MSSQKDPALSAERPESVPHLLSRQSSSTVMTVSLLVFFPPFPPFTRCPFTVRFSLMGPVGPRLTFRGLSTDRLEVFSADLRLTFRGLPAECLGV